MNALESLCTALIVAMGILIVLLSGYIVVVVALLYFLGAMA